MQRLLTAVMVLAGCVNIASAGFQWTAAEWTATPSVVIGGLTPNTGYGTINIIGPTNSSGISAHMVAYAGTSSGGFSANTADASLAISRTFAITEDTPGIPLTLSFRRFAFGSIDNNPIPGNHFGSYSYIGSVFSDSYSPLFGGSTLNLDNTGSLVLYQGNYTFSGTFTVGSVRTSGAPVTATFDVGIGLVSVVPEPSISLLVAGVLGFVRILRRL